MNIKKILNNEAAKFVLALHNNNIFSRKDVFNILKNLDSFLIKTFRKLLLNQYKFVVPETDGEACLRA